MVRVGEDVDTAFLPERVDPGRPRYTIRSPPKDVGGVTPAGTVILDMLGSRGSTRWYRWVDMPATGQLRLPSACRSGSERCRWGHTGNCKQRPDSSS